MRAISSFSLCCALVFSSDRSLPQTLPAPPPPLTDTYKGTDAIFTNWSGVDIYPGPSAGQPRYSVRYTICNLDPKNGLLFMWEKPALSTGLKNSLPPGKCMDSTHDSAAFVADYNAPIMFTQNNQSKNASAYLPSDNTDTTSHVQGWFSNGEQGSIIDFSIHTLFAFGALLISYVYLFYFLPSPPFWMIMIEASLYFLLYLLLSIFVVLLLLVAPHGFFSRAWNWLVPPR
jgi:hypothetical protein